MSGVSTSQDSIGTRISIVLGWQLTLAACPRPSLACSVQTVVARPPLLLFQLLKDETAGTVSIPVPIA
jgi:hypothetical protein